MSNDIVLTAGIRSNLLSLQTTSNLMQTTQERLATGKKVNSALDNAVNYFTAAALSARSNELSSLLDSMTNGVNTLNEQRDEKADLSAYNWWVLEPGTEHTIKGFYKNGNRIMCKNCSAPINAQSLGMEGGCNPVPLKSVQTAEAIIIEEADIAGGSRMFGQ